MRLLSLSIALTVGVASASHAQDHSRQISGQLTYLPRIALPPDAEVSIVAEGAFDAEFDFKSFNTEGQQVPLSFSLEVPRDLSGTVSAVIRVKDQPWWLVEDVGFAAGAEPVDLGTMRLESYTPLSFASRLDCGGTEVLFGIVDDHAVLRVHGQDYRMVEAIAASGARYVNERDDSTEFWSKGKSAMVTVAGDALPECTQVDESAEPYRASGNEPGWNVAIRETQVDLVADYGSLTRTAPRPDVQVARGTYVLDMREIDVSLTLEERLCRDDATGMPHPHSATLQLEDRSLHGCGGDPASLLTGVAWQIKEVASEEAIDGATLTVEFDADRRVSGSTGCNRFMGGYDLTGEGLSLGQIGTTMMMCRDELMMQERGVLDALEQVRRFDIDDTGELLLIGGPDDSTVLKAHRP
ncbi:META domain-containing protein [Roseovarius sp.]|uniref:META domain-containing protein n=1 Tax=Roseovarius sp. TaxID=1486281 RepID=UPI003564632A